MRSIDLRRCRFCLAGLVLAALAPFASAAENVWVGGGNSAQNPGNWNSVANWAQGGKPATTVPNVPGGGNNWEPILIEGTAAEKAYVASTEPIEGYAFRLTARHADITIPHLRKLQTNTSITLRDDAILRLGYQPGGHFEFSNADVGDGCVLELTTPDVNAVNGFAFNLQLNATGLMKMQAWSITGKTGAVSFVLPLEAEAKAVRTRTLIAWPEGVANNLALSAGTVVASAPWASATVEATTVDLFAESPDLAAVSVGAYCVRKETDGFKVAWVVGPATDGVERKPISFNVPEGWPAKPVPTQAVRLAAGEGALALEQTPSARQTLGGRAANVAEVTAGTETHSVYGISSSSQGDKSALDRDVWLKVSGGAYDLVLGGKDNHWQSKHANSIAGDLFTELSGTGVARNVVGGILGCSDGGNSEPSNRVGLPLTGNTLVVVREGAKVSGSIVGSSVAMHGLPFTHTGDSTVRILSLQDTTDEEHGLNSAKFPGGYVVGASARADDQDRNTSANLVGNAKVEICLGADAEGRFEKTILGGSFNNNGNAASTYTISGDTDVVIDAPAAVTFPKAIYAAGIGKNVKVEGKATIALKGGTFTNTIGVGANGATATSSELVVEGGARVVDLSHATVEAFDTLTLKGDVTLGEARPEKMNVVVEGEAEIALAVTAEELANRCVALGRAEAVPEGLTIAATGLPEGEAWALAAVAGELRYVPAKQQLTWQTPPKGAAWADGLPGFKPGDDVAFGANGTEEPVEVGGDVRAGALTVSGDYRLGGAGRLTADTVGVGAEATLTLSNATHTVRYLRVTPSGAASTGSNAYPGVAELILYKEGEPVAWPRGTTVKQVNADGSEVAPQWDADGNEKVNALIDGVHGGTSQTYTNPEDGSTGQYSAAANYNKWWPVNAAGAGAVIALGAPILADGYMIWHTDHVPRSPNACKVEGSADGVTWVALDERTFFAQDARPAEAVKNTAYAEAPFALATALEGGVVLEVKDALAVSGTLAGNGIVEGDVSFAEGSTLKAPAEGMLTIEGAVSGTATLDVSAWGELTDATVRPVLHAPEGLALTGLPENYALHYADGRYWLARALTQPLKLELGAAAEWSQAAWLDSAEAPVSVAPAQWDLLPAENIEAEVTAAADATLTLEAARSVGAFVVKPSEKTLTLGGAKLSPTALTVEEGARLAATPSTLTLPAGATIDGTLTYDVAFGSTALPNFAGSGTLVKTGAGTLTLASDTEVAPMVVVRGGTLNLPSASTWGTVYPKLPDIVAEGEGVVALPEAMGSITDAGATITLRNGGVFRFANGNSWSGRPIACAFRVENEGVAHASFQGSYNGNQATVTGSISGHGLAVFEQGQSNAHTISGVISDDTEGRGALKLKFADDNSAITVSGDNTYTGGTEIASAVTVRNANALGKGAVTVVAGKTLTVASGTTLNVHGALGGVGTVAGAVHLAEGASVDASGATAEACLTLNGTLTAAGAVPVTLPAEVAHGTRLLAWTAAPEAVAFTADALAPTAALVAKADGLYYEVMAFGTVGSDEAEVGSLSEGVQRQLTAAAFAAGATSVAGVTGASGGQPLTAAAIDAALTCFNLTPTVSVDGGVATVTVAYDFGIAAAAHAAGTLSVTVQVRGGTFAEGVTLELYAEADGAALAEPFAAPAGEASTMVALPLPASGKPFKVRAVKAQP